MIIPTLVSLLLSTFGNSSSMEFYSDYHEISNDMLSQYEIELPDVFIDDFEGSRATMAKNVCRLYDDGPACEITFRPCVADLDPYYRRNLIAHEIAHYINAHENGRFDHGRSWRRILREHGWDVHEAYTDAATPQCELTLEDQRNLARR